MASGTGSSGKTDVDMKKMEDKNQVRDNVCYFCGCVHQNSERRADRPVAFCTARLLEQYQRFRLNMLWGKCCVEWDCRTYARDGGYCLRVIHLVHFAEHTDWHSSNFCASGRCPRCGDDALINVGCDCRCSRCIGQPLVRQHCSKW